MTINRTSHSTQHKHFRNATRSQQRTPLKITRSTTCSDLGLKGTAICDGCVRRDNQSENEKKSRQYQCKQYFSDKYNVRKIGKRGSTQGQRAYERAWAQLANKQGHWCMPTEPAEENKEKPQQRFTGTPKATTVKTVKETATLAKITVKQSRQQLIEAFVDESTINEVVMLIDKLLAAIGHNEEDLTDIIDLTNFPDAPPDCDPSTTAAAVLGLCNLGAAPEQFEVLLSTPINMTLTPADSDVVDASQRAVVNAAQILCSASKPKGKEKFNSNNKL
jgi:hypothetical protein